MTEQNILKLYRLRGLLRAKQDIAKAGIRSAKECLIRATSLWAEGYFDGLLNARVEANRDFQHCINELSAIIEEANND